MEQRKLLERELDILRDRLLLMGGEVELAVQRAMHALVQRDSEVTNHAAKSTRLARLLFVAKNLERIGDYEGYLRTHRLYEGSGFYKT